MNHRRNQREVLCGGLLIAFRHAHGSARKEVIQPQLPLLLPCYDFVPITNPTLDTSVPRGFGQWLQVLPAFMT